MIPETIIVLVLNSALMAGIFYGMTNARLKHIERRIEEQEGHNERLARLDEKINLILKHYIK